MELKKESTAMTSRPPQPIGKNQLYALLVDAAGAPVLDGDGSQQVVAVQSTNGKLQVDASITGSLANTVQTHNAVSILASGISVPATWLDCIGYKDIAVTLLNNASTSSSMELYWSHDGITIHGDDPSILPPATLKWRVAQVSIKARYCKLIPQNGDTVAHTMSAWAYLK